MAGRISWMPSDYLRRLVEVEGKTQAEISEINAKLMGGYPPSRAAVAKRLRELDIISPNAYQSRKDLIPWRWLTEEDYAHRYYQWLGAEARKRKSPERRPSETDKHALDLMHDVTKGRGRELVIGHHPDMGWYLTDRLPTDLDVIRTPEEAERLRLARSQRLRHGGVSTGQ